jgi:hypothetical protein
MPFGLTNIPASSQHFINDVLQPYMDIFAPGYLDNVVIYSNNLNNYRNHVLKVLQALSEAGLHPPVAPQELTPLPFQQPQ